MFKTPLYTTFLCIMLLRFNVAHAQDFPRDTSFNLRDDYAKNVKKYPFIKAVPILQEGIEAIRDIPYLSKSKRQLHLDLYRPLVAPRKMPVVIMIHGGGWRSGSKEMMAGFASHLSYYGYTVIVPEFRLSLEAKYPAAIDDIKDVIQWCYKNEKKHQLNNRQLVVLGTSSGAQMASQLGNNVDAALKIAATINVDGVLAFRHPESSEGSPTSEWLGGTYEEATENWLEASALHHVSNHTAPILFLASSIPRFQAGRNDMIKKLEEEHIYYDLKTFEDAPHTYWFYEPWFTPMLEKIDSFLTKVLPQTKTKKIVTYLHQQ